MTTRLKRTIRNCDEDANFDEKNGYSNYTHALKIRAGTCFTPDSNLCSVHPGLQIIPSCTLHQNPFKFLFFLLPLPQSIPRPRPPPYWVSHHRLQLSWVSLSPTSPGADLAASSLLRVVPGPRFSPDSILCIDDDDYGGLPAYFHLVGLWNPSFL